MDNHDVVAPKDLTVVPPQSLGILHPAVEKLLAQSPTPEMLKAILDLQREWQRDLAKKAYTQALVEMKKELPAWIKRDQTVDYTGSKGRVRYTHTSLAAAMEAVQPALNAHGFSLAWTPGMKGEKVTVTATLTHRDGHSDSATLEASPDMSGNKSGPQGIASTITLLERYSALALLGIATSDMNEPAPREPGEQDAGQVDSARNLRAMADLQRGGKTKEQVEAFLGKPIQKWTSGDLAKLKEWIAPTAEHAPAPEAAPQDPERSDYIDAKEQAVLKGIIAEFKMNPKAFAGLIEGEIGRRPESLAKIMKHEYANIVLAFELVRKGEWEIRDGKLSKPPPDDSNIPF